MSASTPNAAARNRGDGTPRLRLTLSSSAPAGFLVVRLCDVAANGDSTRIAIGAHELSTNGGTQRHSPLVPGKPIEIEIELGGIAHRFGAGQRIRIALSNAYWPMPLAIESTGGVGVRVD